MKNLQTCLMILTLLLSLPGRAEVVVQTEQEALEIGVEAYMFLYPLVAMDMTRRIMTNLPPGKKAAFGPHNSFSHIHGFPPIELKVVAYPNFDTLYSSAWLDLSEEPMIVSAPDTRGRYYLLPMLDMWQEVFAVPGWRTTGTQAGHWAVVPPGWQGELPEGIERIDASTPIVWVVGRTEASNSPEDIAAVNAIQNGFKVTPLSRWGKPAKPVPFTVDPTVDMKTGPIAQANTMPATTFFAYATELFAKHPPQTIDWSQLERLKRIGIKRGEIFDLTKADPMIRKALERVPTEAQKIIREAWPRYGEKVNGWQIKLSAYGNWGSAYTKRASVARNEIAANIAADAIYPKSLYDAEGQPLQGGKRYRIHFSKGSLPPVSGFWSVTLYRNSLPVPNSLNRYVIRDRDPLRFNSDGSLDLYIQSQSPGAAREANWLPSPESGAFELVMRMYAPAAEVRDGRWAPPPIQPVH